MNDDSHVVIEDAGLHAVTEDAREKPAASGDGARHGLRHGDRVIDGWCRRR